MRFRAALPNDGGGDVTCRDFLPTVVQPNPITRSTHGEGGSGSDSSAGSSNEDLLQAKTRTGRVQ